MSERFFPIMPRRKTPKDFLVVLAFFIPICWLTGRILDWKNAAPYRRSAEENGRLLKRCQEIAVMSPAERQRQIAQGADNPLNLLNDPDRARRYIPYFAQLRDNDLWQAQHPDDPAPPSPPEPR